ncbi:MAG TPA: FkbM family methyltransferase [Terriglobia bacterium]
MRLEIKDLLHPGTPKSGVVRENILGFQVESFSYGALIFLFVEIFADMGYYFESGSKCPLIIDAGSNIGMALLFFKWLYSNARVLAFEPEDRTFQLLRRNVERNRLTDVTLYNKALGDSAGVVPFHYSTGDPSALSMSMRERSGLDSSTSVECAPLSDYIEREVDFLKMDIEGAEQLVISELDRSGKLKYIREMVIEYHHHHVGPRDDALSETLAILQRNDFGYQIKSFGRRLFPRGTFQALLLYAYRKQDLAATGECCGDRALPLGGGGE